MSTRQVLHLPRRPNAMLRDWQRRLDAEDPGTPAAIAVYDEAARAGLVDALRAALLTANAQIQREMVALQAERARRKLRGDWPGGKR